MSQKSISAVMKTSCIPAVAVNTLYLCIYNTWTHNKTWANFRYKDNCDQPTKKKGTVKMADLYLHIQCCLCRNTCSVQMVFVGLHTYRQRLKVGIHQVIGPCPEENLSHHHINPLPGWKPEFVQPPAKKWGKQHAGEITNLSCTLLPLSN